MTQLGGKYTKQRQQQRARLQNRQKATTTTTTKLNETAFNEASTYRRLIFDTTQSNHIEQRQMKNINKAEKYAGIRLYKC